jgi:large subunit ribosomal protein L21
MYAVIQTGGKQYRVEPGQTLSVEKLPGELGDVVDFNDVLLVAAEDKVTVGRPMVNGAKVTAEIVEHGKDKKVTVFKFQRRKNYRRRYGHRQLYTSIKINEVVAP